MSRRNRRQSDINAINTQQLSDQITMPIIDRIDHIFDSPAQSAPSRVNFQIENFDGDPSKVDWFLNQVKAISEINKWDNKISILFIKSKLVGAAQSWCSNSPTCNEIQTLDEFCSQIRTFFSTKASPDADLKAFQSCDLRPNESIRNFAFRLEVLAHKAYPSLNSETINQIKIRQLLASIPRSVKNSLSDIANISFHDLVLKIEGLYEIPNVDQTNVMQSQGSNNSDEIEQLRVQMQFLTTALTDKLTACQYCSKQGHHMVDCELFKKVTEVKSPNISNFSNQKYPNQNRCAYCNISGHHMAICNQYLRSLNYNQRGRNNNESFRQYNSNQLSSGTRPYSNNYFQGFRQNSFQGFRSNPNFNQGVRLNSVNRGRHNFSRTQRPPNHNVQFRQSNSNLN